MDKSADATSISNLTVPALLLTRVTTQLSQISNDPPGTFPHNRVNITLIIRCEVAPGSTCPLSQKLPPGSSFFQAGISIAIAWLLPKARARTFAATGLYAMDVALPRCQPEQDQASPTF